MKLLRPETVESSVLRQECSTRLRRGHHLSFSPAGSSRLSVAPVTTEVTLEVAPGVQIVAAITTGSAQSLGLKEGGQGYAVVKASSVMVAVD